MITCITISPEKGWQYLYINVMGKQRAQARRGGPPVGGHVPVYQDPYMGVDYLKRGLPLTSYVWAVEDSGYYLGLNVTDKGTEFYYDIHKKHFNCCLSRFTSSVRLDDVRSLSALFRVCREQWPKLYAYWQSLIPRGLPGSAPLVGGKDGSMRP